MNEPGAADPPSVEALRWVQFQLPELRGSTPASIHGLVDQVLTQPVLPFRFSDVLFVASLEVTLPGFLSELFTALVRRAAVGVSTASRLVAPLISTVCFAFGRDRAVSAGLITVSGCVSSLEGCQHTADAASLATVLLTHGIADSDTIALRMRRFCRTLSHAADQWTLASAACVAAIGIRESNDMIVSRVDHTSGFEAVDSGASAANTAEGMGDPFDAEQGTSLAEPPLTARQVPPTPLAAPPAALRYPGTPPVSSSAGPKSSSAAHNELTLDFPSRVPNTPHPAAIATVCSAVLVFRIRRQHTPVLTTVSWLLGAMKGMIALLEANADALSIGPSTSISLGVGKGSASVQSPAGGGVSFLTDGGGTHRPSSVSQGGSNQSKHSAPRPDRPGVEIVAASFCVAAVALTSIMRRRGPSKLMTPDAMRPVPHPMARGIVEPVNLHDAAAFLALRAAALLVEAKSRGRQRFQFAAAELEEAPVALLHLANVGIDFLSHNRLPVSIETQRQLAATLGLLIRASGVVTSPKAAEGDTSTTTSPSPSSSAHHALAFAFRCVDAAAHTHGPLPETLSKDLAQMHRQLELCRNLPFFVSRRVDVAAALAACPPHVFQLSNERFASGDTERYLPVWLGSIPCAPPASQDAPHFHADHALWAMSVVVKVFSGHAATVLSRTSVTGSITSNLNAGTYSAGTVLPTATAGTYQPTFKVPSKAPSSAAGSAARPGAASVSAWRKSAIVSPSSIFSTGRRTSAIARSVKAESVVLSHESRRRLNHGQTLHWYPVVAASLFADDTIGMLARDDAADSNTAHSTVEESHVDPFDAYVAEKAQPSPSRRSDGGASPYNTINPCFEDCTRLPAFMRQPLDMSTSIMRRHT